MTFDKEVIDLPTFDVKKSKKSRSLNLPVKNWLMYGVKILNVDNIKPIKVKIGKSKSTKIPIPIHLVSIEVIDEVKIDELKRNNTQEHLNYTNIDNFGVDKNCKWNIAPTHYDILKMWLMEKRIGIGQLFMFTRIGKGVNSKLIFLTDKESEGYMTKHKKVLKDIKK